MSCLAAMRFTHGHPLGFTRLLFADKAAHTLAVIAIYAAANDALSMAGTKATQGQRPLKVKDKGYR